MLGINQITSELSKKTKLSQTQAKSVLTAFLEITKQKLNQGENLSFKNYFTLKRSVPTVKGTKTCEKRLKEKAKVCKLIPK